MKSVYFVCLFFIYVFPGLAQVLPDERHPDWFQIARNQRFRIPENSVDVTDFGAWGDGGHDDTEAIRLAIQSFGGNSGIVYFPAGSYRITQTISLPDSLILKGESAETVHLLLDPGDQAMHGISISSEQSENFVAIDWIGPEKDNRFVSSAKPTWNIGDFIEIRQENGSWDVVPADWALNSVGQITEIASLNGDTVFVKSPFRINFDTALDVEVRKIVPRVNAGVECLSVKRLNTIETDPGSNIYLTYAAHCRIAGVKSDSSSGSHISVNASANILISGCYLHHAFLYDGSGTRGYGITLSMHSSECLILNSVFRHLRHAMMVKTGSNGNIFAYNYSVDPYRSELIHDFSGDISLHGHYAFSNLFEGNIVQNIITDHFWGPSGPWNTFFRNRSELYGIIMTSSSLVETSSQNYIGNEVTASNYPYGQYILSGEDQFQYSNNINGTIIPPGTEFLNDESYFLTGSPDFWTENLVWPSIGYPNELGEGSVPAKDRYLSDIVPVFCPGDTNLTYKTEYQEDASRMKLFPNPANGRFTVYIQSGDERIEFRLISLTGQCVDMFSTVSGNSGAGISIELKNHPQPGMYFLEAKSESGRKSVQRIVLY
jgi:hypothetical protein